MFLTLTLITHGDLLLGVRILGIFVKVIKFAW